MRQYYEYKKSQPKNEFLTSHARHCRSTNVRITMLIDVISETKYRGLFVIMQF